MGCPAAASLPRASWEHFGPLGRLHCAKEPSTPPSKAGRPPATPTITSATARPKGFAGPSKTHRNHHTGTQNRSGSHKTPPCPLQTPPPCYPRAPGTPIHLFVLRSWRRRCTGVGCSPQRCFALSPHRAARSGLPAWRCGRSQATARRLAGGLTAVTSPAWRRRGGPHCLPLWRGPATMSCTLNCCCETDGVSQAQGEAKVRGQGEQRGGTAPLPTRPASHGEEGAPRPPRVSAGADEATAAHSGREDGSAQPTQRIRTQGPPSGSLPTTLSRQQQPGASRDVTTMRGAGASPQPVRQTLEPPAITPSQGWTLTQEGTVVTPPEAHHATQASMPVPEPEALPSRAHMGLLSRPARSP